MSKNKDFRSKKKKIQIILLIIVVAIVAVLISSIIYINDYYHASDTAIEALASSDQVQVQKLENGTLVFEPEEIQAGIIFYPGGKVQYESYAPLMKAWAKEGFLCILPHMPGNLAVLDINAADSYQELYPEVEHWYMAGHSLGGSMAASYVEKHADEYDGLILLAAYSTADLSDTDLQVISLYGSNDGVLNMEKYEENRDNLPADAVEQIIDGGCHAYFGSYGKQDGDGEPTITQKKQIEITVDAIINYLLR